MILSRSEAPLHRASGVGVVAVFAFGPHARSMYFFESLQAQPSVALHGALASKVNAHGLQAL